jgi:hypothetical protein
MQGLGIGRDLDIQEGVDTVDKKWSATVTKLDIGTYR